MTTNEIIAAIQQTPRCSNIEKWKLVDFLKNEIGKASLCVGGQPMHENDLYFIREEVVKRIYKEYPFLHLGELHIIFDEGSYEKFGQVYSLTPLAINRWIVAYLESDCRKKAIQEVLRISVERQLPAKAPVTPQGEYASLRQMIGEAYDKYLRGEAISDPGCCYYKFLTQLGLLKPCDKFKPYIDRKGKVKKDEYEFPTDSERNTEITRLFDELKFAGQHILDFVPENMVDGYWIMFPTW